MAELEGKVAIVCGATRKRGLGRAIAGALARAGAGVVVTGTGRAPLYQPMGGGAPHEEYPADEEREGWRGLPDVAAECAALGVPAHAVAMDVTRTEDVQRMVGETLERMGRIDILVHNARYGRGIGMAGLHDVPDEMWRRTLDVNLTGMFLCSKYVSKQMVAQGEGGRIIGISSVAAAMAPPGMSAYTASKAGMHALSSVLAVELGPHGITSNIVAPGFIDTAGIDEMRDGETWQRRIGMVPLGGPGRVEECAELVRYLCGPNGRWISGQTLYFDGGEIRAAAR